MTAPFDWSWVERSAGVLSSRDKLRLVAPLLRTTGQYTRTRFRLATRSRGTAALDLDRLRWPDTALARAADAEARAVLPDYLLEHSYRTYLFGLALASADGRDTDHEEAFVSCMLHDLELHTPPAGACFAVAGGRRAYSLAVAHGAQEPAARRIGEAVAGHITPRADVLVSELSGLVSAGASLDVIGLRLDELEPAFIAAVIERHPRAQFTRSISRSIASAAKTLPSSRSAWLNRYAAFPLLVKTSPMRDQP